MNRICNAFSDIGNINLKTADIPPFNWQMFLSGPCEGTMYEACELFCALNNTNKTNVIESQELNYAEEKNSKSGYEMLARTIIQRMTAEFGDLETVYPYIVKYLFTGEAVNKANHKQMFWRVFGDIALRNITNNLKTCKVCTNCNMKYPSWVEEHECPVGGKDFFTCLGCGSLFKRINSKQQRCESCQEEYARSRKSILRRTRYKQKREEELQRTSSLVSRFEKT